MLESMLGKAPRLLPVLDILSVDYVIPLTDLLREQGIQVAEVTLRNPVSLQALAVMKKYAPDMTIGAGTIRSVVEHDQAVAAGADFTVSPGLSLDIWRASREADIPHMPGVATATEVMTARALGAQVLKFFPAGAAGGTAMLKSWFGPFPDVMFCPTGGIDASNLAAYLALPNVLCAGASSFFPADAMARGNWDEIRRRLGVIG